MAEALILLASLVFGLALGLLIRALIATRRRQGPVAAPAPTAWQAHLEAHARAQEFSRVWTPPPAMIEGDEPEAFVPLPDGWRIPVALLSAAEGAPVFSR